MLFDLSELTCRSLIALLKSSARKPELDGLLSELLVALPPLYSKCSSAELLIECQRRGLKVPVNVNKKELVALLLNVSLSQGPYQVTLYSVPSMGDFLKIMKRHSNLNIVELRKLWNALPSSVFRSEDLDEAKNFAALFAESGSVVQITGTGGPSSKHWLDRIFEDSV